MDVQLYTVPCWADDQVVIMRSYLLTVTTNLMCSLGLLEIASKAFGALHYQVK